MRALLTGGIKAILAIAALSTAAHWALRVQRDTPAPAPAMASIPEPTTTGSIAPRRVERSAPVKGLEATLPEIKAVKALAPAAGFDQMHLTALIASTAKPVARPAVRVEPKQTARIEPKPASKPAAKVEPKPAARGDAKPDARR